MCIKVIDETGKQIKLKRLQTFNHHIHKRFYCDCDMNIWYKPKGSNIIKIPHSELEYYADEYPASLPLIFQLKHLNKFIKTGL